MFKKLIWENNVMRRFLSLIGILVLMLSGCHQKEEAKDDRKIVKIGVIAPMTGEVANIGTGFKYATEMAAEDLQKQNLKNHYEFLYEDDGFEAKKTVMAFSKLKNMDGVDAVVSFASQGGAVISPLAERGKIVHFNVGASEPKVAEGKYNFIHWTLPVSTTKKLLDFYRSQGYHKIVLATSYNSGTLAIEEALKKHLPEYPEMAVTIFHFQPNEKDFKMLMSKIKENNPDVVLTLVYGNNVIPFIKQYNEANMPFPLTNSESFSMLPDFGVAEGIYYADVALTKGNLIERLEKQHPNSGTFAIGNAYDTIMLLVEAFEKANNQEQAVDELVRIREYDGEIGHLRQDENGIFHSQGVLKKVINGKPVVVEQ